MISQRENLLDTPNYSCGIVYLPPGAPSLTLARYNGPSHQHGNIRYNNAHSSNYGAAIVAAERTQRDHLLPDIPNSEAYPIDYRFEGKSGGQVFLYGVPNRDKARLTTIILSHFHRIRLDFDSILVFSDQAEIPRLDLARLSDVGGDLVLLLASREDLHRKMERRIALA